MGSATPGLVEVIQLLVQSLGVAYVGAINLPATVAILGLAQSQGWVPRLPGLLHVLDNPWIIGISLILVVIEFVATLMPVIASLWETFQTFVRPPAATVLALATVMDMSPIVLVAAGLLGGTLALSTHGAKLGMRYAVDSSPEPVTNLVANIAELGIVASLAMSIWHHPYISLAVALLLLAVLILLVANIAKAIRRVLTGGWRESRTASL